MESSTDESFVSSLLTEVVDGTIWDDNITVYTEVIFTETEAVYSTENAFNSSIDNVVPHGHWTFRPFIWTWDTIMQLLTSFLGIVGNLLVLIVLLKRRTNGHSADTLVTALAVADLITSIFVIPHPRVNTLPSTVFAEVYCKVAHSGLVMWTSIVASVFTLTSISIERYLAISRPFFFKRSVTRRRVNVCIAVIWILGLLANINSLFIFHVDHREHICMIHYSIPDLKLFWGVCVFVIEFICPTIIMLVTHGLTARILKVELQSFEEDYRRNRESGPCRKIATARKQNLRTLLLIVVTFIICWGPNQIGFLLFNAGVLPPSYLFNQVDTATVVLAAFNSTANPIIYTIRFPAFRSAIRNIFSCSYSHRTSLFEIRDEGSKKSTSHA